MNDRGASKTVDRGGLGGHRLLHILCALVSLVACAPQGPDVSGSNTNWLQRCGHDDECFGGSCIDFVCTLACEPDDDGACEAVSSAATCRPLTHGDRSVCDVGCSAASDCESLGDGYECDGEFCRVESPLGVESSTDSLTLAPSDTGDGTPLVRWVDDHWLLADLQPREGEPTVELREFMLWPHGKLTEQRTTASSTEESLGRRMLSDGVVMEQFRTETGTCMLRYFLPEDLDAPISEPDCALARAHAISGTGQWLVLRTTSDGLYTTLGRYEPRERRWIVEPQVILHDNPWDIVERVDGEDLVLVKQILGADTSNLTQIARMRGVMARKAPGRMPTAEWVLLPPLRLHEEGKRGSGIHNWVPGNGLWFYFVTIGDSGITFDDEISWTVPTTERPMLGRLARDPPLIQPAQFLLDGIDCMEDAPEGDLTAIGHLEPSFSVDDSPDIPRTLMLSLFEHNGRRVAGPAPVLEVDRGFELGCTLTWSNEQSLLVVSQVGAVQPPGSAPEDWNWEWRLQIIELD